MKSYLTEKKSFSSKCMQLFLHPVFLKVILIINIGGSIYGYYWYRSQLLSTPLRYWIFVPDSPLSTTLFALALFFFLLRRKELPLLSYLAVITVIKYGLWAVFVNTHYWLISGQLQGIEIMLWLSHLGMAMEGMIYLRFFSPDFGEWGIVSFWMILNDYVDYAWELHPYLYMEEQLPTVEMFTYCLTAVLIFVTFLRIWRARR